ncbi:PEP-CTERM sorting domain-containing protein [Bythopirellula goksoeyrii]|uniref:PEP-CTERM sorting domain-containing protein n=1 Tax=Bythopirellula goksoeyrii TaxID=1400387 RepID=UPI0036F41F45
MPEPSTWLLLSFVTVGGWLARRRRLSWQVSRPIYAWHWSRNDPFLRRSLLTLCMRRCAQPHSVRVSFNCRWMDQFQQVSSPANPLRLPTAGGISAAKPGDAAPVGF